MNPSWEFKGLIHMCIRCSMLQSETKRSLSLSQQQYSKWCSDFSWHTPTHCSGMHTHSSQNSLLINSSAITIICSSRCCWQKSSTALHSLCLGLIRSVNLHIMSPLYTYVDSIDSKTVSRPNKLRKGHGHQCVNCSIFIKYASELSWIAKHKNTWWNFD